MDFLDATFCGFVDWINHLRWMFCLLLLLPWRWRHYVFSEFCCSSTRLHRRLIAMRLSVFTDMYIFYIIVCYWSVVLWLKFQLLFLWKKWMLVILQGLKEM